MAGASKTVSSAQPSRPVVIRHAGPTQTANQSTQARDIAGPSTSRKFKSEWAASYMMASPAPGKVAASPTQGPPMVQHASPGPSGIQIQPEFANVSIFSYLSYRNI